MRASPSSSSVSKDPLRSKRASVQALVEVWESRRSQRAILDAPPFRQYRVLRCAPLRREKMHRRRLGA